MPKRNLTAYQILIDPVLNLLDSEIMHSRASKLIHLASEHTFGVGRIILKSFAFKDLRLNTTVAGIPFENPVLVGAGWDKTGKAAPGLIDLGFGGVEVGTVLENPQAGNPKPRQFMIGKGVALNRLGFNSPGMDAVAKILERYKSRDLPIGISVGKNKDLPDSQAPQTHAKIVKRLYDFGKYFVINVSSPNTPGLRGLQSKGPLTDIVRAVQNEINKHKEKKPLFVKIAPDMDMSAINDVIEVVEKTNIAGIIATNTTVNEKIKGQYFVKDSRLSKADDSGKKQTWAGEAGGLSGDNPDFRKMATEIIRHIYKEAKKRKLKITIIGLGGVKDAETALEKIKSGANLVQVVTAIRGEGPGIAGSINRGIVKEMKKLGLTHFEDLVGLDFKNKK